MPVLSGLEASSLSHGRATIYDDGTFEVATYGKKALNNLARNTKSKRADGESEL